MYHTVRTLRQIIIIGSLHTVPPPTVTIIRDPFYPVQLFTSDRLTLTCVIQLIPEVDSLVTINSRWSGHSSLTDSQRRVIVSELEGRQLSYESSVTFSTLKTSDSGSYVCSANIVPEEDNLLASSWASDSLNITVCECTEFHSDLAL